MFFFFLVALRCSSQEAEQIKALRFPFFVASPLQRYTLLPHGEFTLFE
jgi:hypothetical protein